MLTIIDAWALLWAHLWCNIHSLLSITIKALLLVSSILHALYTDTSIVRSFFWFSIPLLWQSHSYPSLPYPYFTHPFPSMSSILPSMLASPTFYHSLLFHSSFLSLLPASIGPYIAYSTLYSILYSIIDAPLSNRSILYLLIVSSCAN